MKFFAAQKSAFVFHFKNRVISFGYWRANSRTQTNGSQNSCRLLPARFNSYFSPTVWILEIVKTDLNNFLVQKIFQLIWCNTKFSRKMKTKTSDRYKFWNGGGAHINQFLRLWTQRVVAAGNFSSEENLSLEQIPTVLKEMDQQLKLAHEVVDVLIRANKKIFLILCQYILDKAKSSYNKVQILASKKDDEKFQQFVCDIYTWRFYFSTRRYEISTWWSVYY